MYRGAHRRTMSASASLAIILALLVSVLMTAMMACTPDDTSEDPSIVFRTPSGVESYDECGSASHAASQSREPVAVADATCVQPDAGLYWVVPPLNPAVPFAPCATEDGPAPCVWDAVSRGDGRPGPGVRRFIVLR
jgi:hypothetical protein